ncbi:MAG: hypothetical protein D6689_19270 [Deltaproteobacteria bacterium]|nr:MAG: hypothetical protein D6689_19270 [Deltaproteobacteria bacterium]
MRCARGWVIAVAVAVGCGGRSVPERSRPESGADAAPPAAEPAGPPLVKRSEIGLVIDGGRVELSITNEVGAVDLVPVAEVDGPCAEVPPVAGGVWGVRCASVRLELVHRPPDLVVLRAPAGDEPPSFDVWRAVRLPEGGRIEFVR